jgi:hypothetical protein
MSVTVVAITVVTVPMVTVAGFEWPAPTHATIFSIPDLKSKPERRSRCKSIMNVKGSVFPRSVKSLCQIVAFRVRSILDCGGATEGDCTGYYHDIGKHNSVPFRRTDRRSKSA